MDQCEGEVAEVWERVTATDRHCGEAYRTSAQSCYRMSGFPWRECLRSVVTHWMPLPEPRADIRISG